METPQTQTAERVKVYEIGYLLIPTIAEEQLAGEVQTIKSLIEKHEGVFITEDFPKLRPLAYQMKKTTGGTNAKYNQAYFGWVKFEVNANAVPLITKDIDRNTSILRYMIINTVRENTMYTQKAAYKPSEAGTGDAVAPEEAKEKMSEEEIDKTIENLVVE
jgi:ribosomal protein S6